MNKIKLNLRGLGIPEKIARSQQIVAAMTGNASFSTPQPTLVQVTSAASDLNAAYAAAQAARQETKTKISEQNQKEEALDRVLTQLASYVESISGEDEAKIMSAGMELRAAQSTTGDLNAPAALAASAGDRDGEIDLAWDKVDNARSYVIERSADPPTASSWTHAAVSTRSRVTIEGLTSGTKYWFRVAAVGSGGQSPWSDPATKLAP